MITRRDFVDEFNEILNEKLLELGGLIKTTEGSQLWGFVCDQILGGGKRFRPYLAYLVYNAYKGSDRGLIMNAAVALELFHAYVLVHDDVIDSDTKRYGNLNVIGKYANIYPKGGIAEGMGVVAGDIVHSFAYRVILGLDIPTIKKSDCIRHFVVGDLNVNVGQQLDTLNVNDAIESYSLDKLEEINHYKSSGYSTILPGYIGLELAGASSDDYDDFHAFAEPLGALYQLVDDYSDYFSNRTGFNKKDKFRDFRQGKVTYPLYLLKQAHPTHAFIERFGDKTVDDDYLAQLVVSMQELGVKRDTETLIDHFARRANSAIDNLKIDEQYKERLRELVVSYAEV